MIKITAQLEARPGAYNDKLATPFPDENTNTTATTFSTKYAVNRD